jgi:hypothetical protein
MNRKSMCAVVVLLFYISSTVFELKEFGMIKMPDEHADSYCTSACKTPN